MLIVPSFLKTLFPLAVVGISILVLLIQAVIRNVRLKRHAKYDTIPTGPDIITSSEPHSGHRQAHRPGGGVDRDEDEEDLVVNGGNGGRLVLTKTTTQGSVAAIDNPRGQYTLLVIELVAIAAVLAINITALVLHVYGPKGTLAAASGVVTWAYIFLWRRADCCYPIHAGGSRGHGTTLPVYTLCYGYFPWSFFARPSSTHGPGLPRF